MSMSPVGPKYPGTAASAAGAGLAWTNPSNAKLEDASVATSGTIGPGGGGGIPNQLQLSNFDFNIPSTAVIDGIVLEAKVQSFATAVTDYDVHLETTGGVVTTTPNTPDFGHAWPTSASGWLTWGTETSLWGRVWTPAQINSSSFLFSISGYPGSGTGTITVDSVRATIYWHTPAAEVPKRAIYRVYDSARNYLGLLPNVKSELSYSWDMNSVGSQMVIECGISQDVSASSADIYTDPSNVNYTDEAAVNNYTTEGDLPVMALGESDTLALIKNGNIIVVSETHYYYPNGKPVFRGRINTVSTVFGGEDGDVTRITLFSDGADLDNYVARGAPYSYTTDQSQTASVGYYNDVADISGSYTRYGQTFTTGTGTPADNIGVIRLKLYGTALVIVKVYSDISLTNLLGTSFQYVYAGSGPAFFSFAFSSPIIVTDNTQYFFEVTVPFGENIGIYATTTNVYAGGSAWSAVYGGGSGGVYAPVTGDLYFETASSSGSTTGTYSSDDPSQDMLKNIIDDYNTRGGLIRYSADSITATGLSLTYTFNTNTIYEAIKAILSISPNGFYYYVDLGENILYFKQANTVADFTLIKGRHISELEVVATIANIKNSMLFSGGTVVAGPPAQNLYKQYQDIDSITRYGIRLERQSDNRVTLTATADAIGNSFIEANHAEQYQTVVTIPDRKMDISSLTPGMIIGFSGFGTFVDGMLAQIVRIEKTPDSATLTLGFIPPRLNNEFEKVTRGLIAEQTVANPSTPS